MEKTELMEVKQMSKLEKIISYFFIYSFIGWVLEIIYCLATLHTFNNRGFLYGPICPMYGIAAILLIKLLEDTKMNKVFKFITIILVFTLFEYAVSFSLEAVFNLRWWDYTNDFMNIQGRISLPFSIAWGVIGLIVVDLIHPKINKVLERITIYVSKKIRVIILGILVSIFIVDEIFSIIKYVGM